VPREQHRCEAVARAASSLTQCPVGQTIAVRGLPIAVNRCAQPTQATENDRLRHHGQWRFCLAQTARDPYHCVETADSEDGQQVALIPQQNASL
jgi:hypothetical protein